MHYNAYIKRQKRAALVVGGSFESLAGGFYGVLMPSDRFNVLVSLDLDGSSGWWTWIEDFDGERCCDETVNLGWVSDEVLKEVAFLAALMHECS